VGILAGGWERIVDGGLAEDGGGIAVGALAGGGDVISTGGRAGIGGLGGGLGGEGGGGGLGGGLGGDGGGLGGSTHDQPGWEKPEAARSSGCSTPLAVQVAGTAQPVLGHWKSPTQHGWSWSASTPGSAVQPS